MAHRAVIRELDLPITEASGLCSFIADDGAEYVALVGDATNDLAFAAMNDGGELEWTVVDVGSLAGAPDDLGQLEAVESAGDRVVVVMGEEPSLLAAIDFREPRLEGFWHMVPGDDEELARLWDRDENSRGEALVLGPDGHVLVVKEKDPVLVVEFGPGGDRPVMTDAAHWGVSPWQGPKDPELVALEWSLLDTDLRDVSDAFAGHHEIMLLSDRDRALAPLSFGAGGWAAGRSIKLDRMIEKPEGLTCLSDGRWFVAMDSDNEESALVEIEPPE